MAYAMYLWKMIWPSHLAPIYPHPGDSLAAWQVAVSALVLLAVTGVVLASDRSDISLQVGCGFWGPWFRSSAWCRLAIKRWLTAMHTFL